MSSHHLDTSEQLSTVPLSTDQPETTKKERISWYFYDWSNSVWSSVVNSGFGPTLLNLLGDASSDSNGYLHIGVISIRPVAFVTTCQLAAAILQALLFFVFASIADFGSGRKKMLIGFGTSGALIAISMYFAGRSGIWWLFGLLYVLGSFCFGVSIICYNAFLPLLAANEPEVRDAPSGQERVKRLQERSDHMSSHGFACGYWGGVLCLFLCIGIILLMEDDSVKAYSSCILLAGVWWLFFNLIPFTALKTRPGPPLPRNETHLTATWHRVQRTAKKAKTLPNIIRFLAGFFFLADGYNTLATLGALFATDELGMSDLSLVILLIEAPLLAGLGNYLFMLLNRRFNLKAKQIIAINGFIILLCPLYGLLGFIPSSPIGLKQQWEIFMIVAVYAFNLGSIQSYSRSLFSFIVPPGCEAEFFGFFEISDRCASVVVPTAVAILSNQTGTLRWGMLPIVISMSIGLPILLSVDVEAGHEQALASKIEPSFNELLVVGPTS